MLSRYGPKWSWINCSLAYHHRWKPSTGGVFCSTGHQVQAFTAWAGQAPCHWLRNHSPGTAFWTVVWTVILTGILEHHVTPSLSPRLCLHPICVPRKWLTPLSCCEVRAWTSKHFRNSPKWLHSRCFTSRRWVCRVWSRCPHFLIENLGASCIFTVVNC